MATVAFSDENTLNLLLAKYGTKSVVIHYAKKARDSVSRLNLAIGTENSLAMAAEAKLAEEHLKQLVTILGNDNNLFGDEPEAEGDSKAK